MKKRALIPLLIAIGTFAVLEITLRKFWGFGDMLLFQEDEKLEYITKPNQEKYRFGTKNFYNEYSMRSDPLTSTDTSIVLGFGDSVINGGVSTDQDSLATTIVEKQLNGVRFLNISAGSWGPDNCAEYLKKYGAFNAKMIVLFVSSHDAYDNMTFEPTVGHHVSYPDEQYPLATVEVLARYIIPRVLESTTIQKQTDSLLINKKGVGFNPGFEFFYNYTKKSGIPFVVCLHAEKGEIEQTCFNSQGEEILGFCKKNNIKVISGLEVGENHQHFSDGIHLNAKGQRFWSNVLLDEVRKTLPTCL